MPKVMSTNCLFYPKPNRLLIYIINEKEKANQTVQDSLQDNCVRLHYLKPGEPNKHANECTFTSWRNLSKKHSYNENGVTTQCDRMSK